MSMSPEYDPNTTSGDLWVFAYGSLLWNPGFTFAEARAARLVGYHRALCVYSHRYRGSPETPGLVLGLDRGGICNGLAYRVIREDAAPVQAYLREREMVTGVYLEDFRRVSLEDGYEVPALSYVADRTHRQYAGHLDREARLALVRQGVGLAGANVDYVLNTARRLRDLGVSDPELEWFAARLEDSLGGSEV